MVTGAPNRAAAGRLAVLAVVVAALVLAAAGCGGGSKSASVATSGSSPNGSSGGNEVVVRTGSIAITRAEVSHWMSVLAGGDYYEDSNGGTVPADLVSDPPQYGVCVTDLGAAASSAGKHPSPAQLQTTCQQLYQAIRLQAVELLLEIDWVSGWAAEQKVAASDPEVLAVYKKTTAQEYSSPALLARSRAAKRTTIADELVLFRKSVLSERVQAKWAKEGTKAVAGLEARWVAKTDCSPRYVVLHCKQFRGPRFSPTNPPPVVVVKQVVALTSKH